MTKPKKKVKLPTDRTGRRPNCGAKVIQGVDNAD